MSQLISIIISITLSAIISAIGYVFFGKAITTSSTKATFSYGMERRFHCMLDTNIDAYVLQYIVE